MLTLWTSLDKMNCWKLCLVFLLPVSHPINAFRATCGDVNSVQGTATEDGNTTFTMTLTNNVFNASEDLVPGIAYTVHLRSVENVSLDIVAYDVETSRGPVLFEFQNTTLSGTPVCVTNGSGVFLWKVPRSNESCYNFSFKLVTTVVAGERNMTTYSFTKTICRPTGCRRYYSAETGSITSPNFPGLYPDNFRCTYVIYSYEKHQLHIQIQRLHLESPYNGHCVDGLSLSDGRRHIATLCGHVTNEVSTPMQYTSTTGIFELDFFTDSKTTFEGFEVHFYSVTSSDCSGVFTNMTGVINSPQNRSGLTECDYFIELPYDFHVEINFVHLNLPLLDKDPCNCSYVEISSPDETGRKRWCGTVDDAALDSLVYKSTNSRVLIKFVTSKLTFDTSFKISYAGVQGCRNETMSGRNGTLYSSNFPFQYLNGQQCVHSFELSSLTVIELVFEVFHTESDGDLSFLGDQCDRDFVEIHFGNETHRICGNWRGKEHLLYFRFLADQLLFRFVSNEQITRKGYMVRWSTSPSPGSQTESCSESFLTLPSYCYEITTDHVTWDSGSYACRSRGATLVTVKDNVTQAAIGTELKRRNLGNVSFWIGANDRLFEGYYVWSDRQLVNYQNWFPGWISQNSSTSQPSDDGLSGEDCVEIRRQFELPGKGVGLAEHFYWNDRRCDALNGYICQFDRNTENIRSIPVSCSNIYHLSDDVTSVSIESPNYPDRYPAGVACDVIVTAPFGQHISMDFEDFELEQHAKCDFDNLTMSSTPGIDTAGTICGDWSSSLKKIRWVSTTNFLFLRFRSDYSNEGRGFSANVTSVFSENACTSRNNSDVDWELGPGGCYVYNDEPGNFHQAAEKCISAGGVIATTPTPPVIFFLRSLLDSETVDVINGSSTDGRDVYIWSNVKTQPSVIGSTQDDGALCQSYRVPLGDGARFDTAVVPVLIQCVARARHVCWKHAAAVSIDRRQYAISWREGSITSPAYPLRYTDNCHVTYIFKAPNQHRIFFQIRHLDLEYQETCLYDRIRTTGMVSDAVVCSFQNTSNPFFLSRGQSASIVFSSDSSINKSGFNITWQWINVSAAFQWVQNDNTSGALSNWNYPKAFPDTIDVCQTLMAPHSFRIILDVEFVSLSNGTLNEQGLQVFTDLLPSPRTFLADRSISKSALLRSLVASTTETLKLCLKIPYLQPGQGFKAAYTFVPETPATISRTFFITPSENVTLYQEDLLHNFDHVITVSTMIGYNVVVLLEGLHHLIRTNCNDSYISVSDVSFGEQKEMIVNYTCSREDSPSTTEGEYAMSYLNRLEVMLKDYYYGNADLRTGFKATFVSTADPDYLMKTRMDKGSFDQCNSTTCLNGGSCISKPSQRYTCECPPTFTGLFCQITKCQLNQCINGVCNISHSTERGFLCFCSDGFWGDLCDMDDTQCQVLRCSVHGTCNKMVALETTCSCYPSWSGSSCEAHMPGEGDSIAIGQKLLKEPIWIGMIVILCLVAISCIVYCARQRCDSCLPHHTKQQDSATKAGGHRGEEPPLSSIFTTNIEISSSDDSSSFPGGVPVFGDKPETAEDISIRRCLDAKNHSVAERFFQAYETSRCQQSRSSMNLLSNTTSEIIPCGLVGGTVSFGEGALSIRNTTGPLGEISLSNRSSLVRASSTDSCYLNMPQTKPPLAKYHPFHGPDSVTVVDVDAKGKGDDVKENISIVSSDVGHCYPEIKIIIANNSESDVDSVYREIENDDTSHEPIGESIEIATPITDSGYRSTTYNTRSDASGDIRSLSLAVEKRKCFRLNSKSGSFYNLHEPSEVDGRGSVGHRSEENHQKQYQTQCWSDSKYMSCSRDLQRNTLVQRDAYSYDEDLLADSDVISSFASCQCAGEIRRKRRSQCRKKECRKKSRDQITRRIELLRNAKSMTFEKEANGFLHPFDIDYPQKEYRVKVSTSTESEVCDLEHSDKLKRKLYKKKGRKHHSDDFQTQETKRRIEAWAATSGLEIPTQQSFNERSLSSVADSTRLHTTFTKHGKREPGRVSLFKTNSQNTRSLEMNAGESPPVDRCSPAPDLRFVTPEGASVEGMEEGSSNAVTPVTQLAPPSWAEGGSSLTRQMSSKPCLPAIDVLRDSAYQTKQSSVDKVSIEKVASLSRGMSDSMDACALTTKVQDAAVSNEDGVRGHLQQAAMKLAMMNTRLSRQRLSNDSANHTFSEDDSSSDVLDSRCQPLTKRLSGSVALLFKETNLSNVTEEHAQESYEDVDDVFREETDEELDNQSKCISLIRRMNITRDNTVNHEEIEMTEISV